MDKYTVDLDKVLNDFEYSEYSLESAKVNKTIQDEPPNSSFNTNHSSRHDTAVKHSINNVFHSLNEYLSSDITPKKIENVEKNLKTIDISGGPQSSSFLMKPQHIAPQKVQALESYHKLVDPPSKDLTQDVLQEDINRKEFSNIFNNSLVDTTDSNTCAINSDQEIVNDNAEVNFNDESVNMKTNNNKCLLDETPEKENSLCDPQMINWSTDTTHTITNFNENLTEEILVDLRCNEEEVNVDNNINSENKFTTDVNEENKPVENYEDFVNMQKEFCSINTIPKTNDVNSENEKDLNSIQDSLANERDEINTCSLMESDEKVSVGDVKHNDIEKIGFDSNVELDEENIEQYFKDLEEELGIQDQQEKNVRTVEETAVNVNEKDQLSIQDSEVIIPECEISEKEHSQLEIREEKNVNIESSVQEHSIESHQQSDEEKKEIPVQTSDSNEETVPSNPVKPEVSIEEHKIEADERKDQTVPDEDHSVKKNMDIIEEKEAQTQMEESEVPKKSSNDENIQTVDANSRDTPNTAESQSAEDPQESEKNSRPQNLSLVEETQETTRKISLIGEPGSTPYNNLYSTKDYVKTISDGSGDTTTARATSPTYSDVSTDSVSSSSSDDTAEYNDAVSEVQNEKQVLPIEKSTVFFKDIMQNNMVHTVETSRSDVTMDKDFKNNLKTGNVRTDGGPSTSSGQLEETGELQSDRQDLEGACALEVQNNASENQENVEKTEEQGVGEARNALISVEWLGKQAPLWLPDSVATSCLHCNMKFTVIKRRHHCRACGLVLCSKCCSLKFRLEYLNADARVCTKCFEILDNDNNSNSGSEMSQESSSPSRNPTGTHQEGSNQPNPNNPLEYCSTIPPTQQAEAGAAAVPSVMVPVGVLKRKGSNKGRSNKSVMFCDGIRPGSDLTNLDTDFNYSENQKAERSKKSPDKSSKSGRNLNMIDTETKSFIPNDEKSLPPTVTIFKTDIKYSPCANNASVVEMLRNESLTFALQSNVFVHVKIINMDCCISRIAWCFSTEGLINVGQDEIVILLEFVENESVVPKEIFVHLNYIYLEAVKGSSVKELGMSLHPSSPFLGSKNHFGFIFIRPTFQCLQNVIIPKEPYLIGILIHRWETPWAKLFPLRLVLRLGAEYKYYPSPIISTRDRDSVFVEIGHTIINLLADFRNFSYSLPQIRGLTIHMEDRNTTVTIPENRYDQVLKSLSNSSDHILAFAGNFSSIADSHLVCIQDTQSATNNYSTHAINICNQPRKVTGASFIVFNGALKSTSGLTAKSNIVEDGLMIQILPEHMLQVRDALKNMKNHTIKCGCVNEESDETVTIVWGEPDTTFNVGVLSPIDNKNLTGVPSIRVHNGKDYTCNSGNRLIRWTEVFITQKGDDSAKNQDPVDISKISENISKATCQALVKYLDLLVSNSFYKIGLRAHIHVENVSYSAGSNNVKLPPIYMKSLDNELIPVLHRIASNNVTEQPIVLELIFRILNI